MESTDCAGNREDIEPNRCPRIPHTTNLNGYGPSTPQRFLMALIKDITNDCSTSAVHGLDDQLIAQMNKIQPGLLVRIDDLNLKLADDAVHPWIQPAAKRCIEGAIAARSQKLIINSAYRTLAGQMLLYNHCQNGRCNISAASVPGKSNHNNASAIDIEDAYKWQEALEDHGWHKLGDFDPMHYDCVDNDIKDIHSIAVLAFQQLWNIARPTDKVAEDGDFGDATSGRLGYSPGEGFPGVGIPRILKLTEPLQIGQDVGKLQVALRDAGIPMGKADMVFGPATDKAIRQFQAAHKLPVDGVIGPVVRAALKL